jgi:hypothetical protein
MSLHTLANHLQSAGRGQDSVLVHMTPGEVKGLQSLAMSQGGSLTINPQTGLPEAGILSSLLPMVAGFFLGPAGIGLTAMQSALAVGALGTAATGSLGKGFMMGLGAYGGAGLGQGLITAGSAAAPNAAGNALASSADDVAAAGIKSSGQTINSGAGLRAKLDAASYTPETISGLDKSGGISAFKPYAPSQGSATLQSGLANSQVTTSPMARYASTNTFTPTNSPLNESILNSPTFAPQTATVPAVPTTPTFAGIQGTNPNAMAIDAGKLANPIEGASGKLYYNTEAIGNVNAAGKINAAPSSFGRFDDVGRGFDKATSSWEGAKEVWNATPTGTGYGLAATGMGVLQSQQEEAAAEAKAKADAMAAARRGHYRPYDFSTEQDPNAYANTSTAESRYFVEPRFVARPIEKIAKDGGLMGYAVGGPVEQMSAENAIGGNMMYPQSQLKTDMYSNPMVQRPMPTNVIRSGIDAPVGAYTGEQRFAFGGSATASASAPNSEAKYSYDPASMKYTMTSAPSSDFGFGKLYGKNVNPFLGATVGIMSLLTKKPINELLNTPASNEPTVGSTSGGIAAPYMPPSGLAASDTSMVPNIQIPQQQNVDRQLGLEAFYPMMEQQLAAKGSQLQAQGYANGGIARFGGGGAAQLTPEGAARQNYARENSAGIIKGVSDDEWNKYKKSQNLSFESAASKAPTYTYNPQNLQFTDNAGKVTMGMQPQFIPMELMQPEQQIGMTGYQGYAEGGTANGGYSLGSYSDGGRLLRGPGNGTSDSIPAIIGDHQPARLAEGEFVIPARIVSELGNGSTEAGAKQLYAMMDRVQKARRKTVGKDKVAHDAKARNMLPA